MSRGRPKAQQRRAFSSILYGVFFHKSRDSLAFVPSLWPPKWNCWENCRSSWPPKDASSHLKNRPYPSGRGIPDLGQSLSSRQRDVPILHLPIHLAGHKKPTENFAWIGTENHHRRCPRRSGTMPPLWSRRQESNPRPRGPPVLFLSYVEMMKCGTSGKGVNPETRGRWQFDEPAYPGTLGSIENKRPRNFVGLEVLSIAPHGVFHKFARGD